MVRAKFGAKGVSKPSLKRLLADVKGVDPINFAPALLPGYRSATPLAPGSAEAWSFFMTTIRDAGPEFPLKQAWRDVRDVAKGRGWDWPSFPTIYRRWTALPEAQKLAARHGREAAVRALAMPVMRDKGTLRPLALVSLDGRTLDFWADFGDGKAVRPVMLALVDVASNFVLGYELARSENAVATSRLIRSVCREHGIFDTLYTDNGSAFSGHLVAGGTDFKWRGKTRTLAQFAASEEDVAHITFKRGEGKPSDVSEVLFQRYLHWVNPNGMSLPLRRKTLLLGAFGRCRMLIADEAQHMDADGIEWLRGLAEEADLSIAFAGDLKLPDLINPIPQLRSRMLRPITATRASLGDVQALAGAWNVSDAKVVRALKAVADRDGGLRNVVHVLRVAADFADGEQIAAAHVQAAILDMKLAPMGGK